METQSTKKLNRAALPLLDSDVLRTFVTIAECGSFTRAAEKLFRTPSALSMQIKRLEAMLEQTQFVREARSVRLNAEGEMLLGYSRRILKLNAEAVSKFLAPTLEGREDGDAFLRPPASHFGKTWMYMAKNRSERSERSE